MEIIKKEKRDAKKIKGFALDEKEYHEFRDECKSWNLSMSKMIGEFISRVTKLLKSGGGGEVVFGVEGKDWEQPKKILYDGKEITEENGLRQYSKRKKEEGKSE